MNQDELNEIVKRHGMWLRGELGGARANLARAYLAGANLAGANLADADLAGANLADAYLACANLADADLAGANLARAYLARADLADANLARAYLADAIGLPTGTERTDPPEPYERKAPSPEKLRAYAQRYRERHPEVPVVPNLDSTMLAAVTIGGGALNMSDWHSCNTTHCRAGWAIHLAGEPGYALEKRYGPRAAGAMIYRASTGRAPHFFATTEQALADIKACAAQERAE